MTCLVMPSSTYFSCCAGVQCFSCCVGVHFSSCCAAATLGAARVESMVASLGADRPRDANAASMGGEGAAAVFGQAASVVLHGLCEEDKPGRCRRCHPLDPRDQVQTSAWCRLSPPSRRVSGSPYSTHTRISNRLNHKLVVLHGSRGARETDEGLRRQSRTSCHSPGARVAAAASGPCPDHRRATWWRPPPPSRRA